MVKVAGHWEIGYMTPIQEQYYWAWVLREFNVTEWLMHPVSGISNYAKQTLNLYEYPTLKEMLTSCEGLSRVFFEPKSPKESYDTVWLTDFEHPKDCVYVFGSAHLNPTLAYKRDWDTIVTIPTEQNKGSLWANQCLLLALYDRMVKKCQ